MPGVERSSPALVIRPVEAADWPRVRDLRLEMLQDTPKAYLERFEDAHALDDAQWRDRVELRLSEGSALFAAILDEDWVGTAAVFAQTPEQVHLVSVFVTPSHRGTGVMNALLTATQDWARALGARTMRLLVHEENARARAYYRKAGFVETGARMPYELDPTETEIEMATGLGPVARAASAAAGDSLR